MNTDVSLFTAWLVLALAACSAPPAPPTTPLRELRDQHASAPPPFAHPMNDAIEREAEVLCGPSDPNSCKLIGQSVPAFDDLRSAFDFVKMTDASPLLGGGWTGTFAGQKVTANPWVWVDALGVVIPGARSLEVVDGHMLFLDSYTWIATQPYAVVDASGAVRVMERPFADPNLAHDGKASTRFITFQRDGVRVIVDLLSGSEHRIPGELDDVEVVGDMKATARCKEGEETCAFYIGDQLTPYRVYRSTGTQLHASGALLYNDGKNQHFVDSAGVDHRFEDVTATFFGDQVLVTNPTTSTLRFYKLDGTLAREFRVSSRGLAVHPEGASFRLGDTIYFPRGTDWPEVPPALQHLDVQLVYSQRGLAAGYDATPTLITDQNDEPAAGLWVERQVVDEQGMVHLDDFRRFGPRAFARVAPNTAVWRGKIVGLEVVSDYRLKVVPYTKPYGSRLVRVVFSNGVPAAYFTVELTKYKDTQRLVTSNVGLLEVPAATRSLSVAGKNLAIRDGVLTVPLPE